MNEEKLDPTIDHHPWCNFFQRPRENCRMCSGEKGLWEMYPLNYEVSGDAIDNLMEKYFPENTRR